MNGATGTSKWTFSTAGRRRSAGALPLGRVAAFVDRRLLAGDDDLARAVVVRRPDTVNLLAQRLDDLVGETEDRGHRPRALARRGGHRESPLTHERDRRARRERTRCTEGRELTDRVPDHE